MSKPGRPRPFHKPPLCSATGKARFRDKGDAMLAIRSMTYANSKRVALGMNPSPVPVRAYSCTECGGHHVTRMPLDFYVSVIAPREEALEAVSA